MVALPFLRRGLFALLAVLGACFGAHAGAAECPVLLRHTFPALQDGKPQDLCQYAGKVLLVVNSASYCGYTNQYDSLEALYKRLQDQGLVVLGFPSNDFGGQEPGSDKQIADFCRTTYGIRYPMFAKSEVIGSRANAFYVALAKRSGATPQWNFHKYLIDRRGEQVESFGSDVRPDDPRLLRRIDAFLKQAAP
ncbi:MAG TPA: glutathione peroxidase [Rhodocyclaceae bacterium]|nr:glutathione peroxidase [Rhodocyclaceae bacterium]